VLLRAYLTPGGEGWAILDRAEASYSYTLLLSDFMLARLAKVLRYDRIRRKYPHLTEGLIQSHLSALRQTAELVSVSTEVSTDEGSRDEEDNRVLAAAVDGKADYVVTLNTAHFPDSFRGVRVISPEAFLSLLRQQRGAAPG